MKVATSITDEFGLAVLRDADLAPPAGDKREDSVLKELARSGEIFYIDGEDPIVNLTMEVLHQEEIPPDLRDFFGSVGGSFLLRVPSGRLRVSAGSAWLRGESGGIDELEVGPGDYAVHISSSNEIHSEALDRAMHDSVGREEWGFKNRVDSLYLLGCLPSVLAAILLFFSSARSFFLPILGVVIACWVPFAVLVRTRRYRRAERARASFEASIPNYSISLERLESNEGLVGGWVVT